MATENNYTCMLSEEDLIVAKDDLNEDPDTRKIEVKTLKQRLDKYPGLSARTDTLYLLRFLRARKFSQEEAFELVLNYYKARKEEPEIFRDLRPHSVRHVFESGYTTPLGIKDKLGAYVLLERPGKWEFSRFSELDLLKADCLTIGKIIQEEWVQVHGITLLMDYEGFTLSHFTHTPPSFARRISKLWQDVFPARLRAVHIVNEPASFGNIFALFKPFLKQKLLQRIHFHGNDYTSLHEHIDRALLPKAFDGERPDKTDQDWCDVMIACDKEFDEDNKYGMVDMMVGEEPVGGAAGEVGGEQLAGTFKKLAVE